MVAEFRKYIVGKTLKTRFTKVAKQLCPEGDEVIDTDMDIDEEASYTTAESQEEIEEQID